MSKSKAYLFGLFAICLFGCLAIVFPERLQESLGAILTAISGLTGGFFTIQMVNNGVRGKFFNKDLHDAENGGGKQ